MSLFLLFYEKVRFYHFFFLSFLIVVGVSSCVLFNNIIDIYILNLDGRMRLSRIQKKDLYNRIVLTSEEYSKNLSHIHNLVGHVEGVCCCCEESVGVACDGHTGKLCLLSGHRR